MSAAVIFDLDDTLLDTSALLDARDRRDWAEVYARMEEAAAFSVADGQPAVEQLPGLVRAAGYRVGVYTHSPKRYATELLSGRGIAVDALITGSDGFPTKPDPAGLLATARLLGVPPADCVYVGDSVGDFGAAAAGGMTSVGVSWTRRTPESWRHGWPDIAVDQPNRLLEFLRGGAGLGPVGEEVAAGVSADWHWGSVLRLGSGMFALGRYFPMGDKRYPWHELSHLIIDAKDDPRAGDRLAAVFAALSAGTMSNPPQLIVSVPPAPDDDRDRFGSARAALAETYDARDGGEILVMRRAVDDYKHVPRDARPATNRDRFATTVALDGERAVLIDDVLTSGGQANACREVLRAAGCGPVSVIAAAVTQDSLPDPCPACGSDLGGTVRTRRRRRDGHEFQGCSRFPQCRWTRNLPS